MSAALLVGTDAQGRALRGPRARVWEAVRWLVVVAVLLMVPVVMSGFEVSLLTRFLALAILAVGLDLAWGYGGMLSLGHGLFFGLGAYAMAMHLKLEAAGGDMPDFMVWSGRSELPWWWEPFRNAGFATAMALLLPAAVAAAMGYFVFRNRIRGAYFAILTQATVVVFTILLVGYQGYTGGSNGLTDLETMFGLDLGAVSTQRLLYFVTAGALVAVYLLARQLVRSRWGRLLIAVRDTEDRVRFLGYNPVAIKVVAFALSAALAGLGGALFVPVVGIVAPEMLGAVASIEMVIWVALGGRGSLVGAILGALLVNYAQFTISSVFPAGWSYAQGALLVVVIVAAPLGLVGLLRSARGRFDSRIVPTLATKER
jgi:urea transport system permease protein